MVGNPPRGALLYNNFIRIIRDLYDIYGYTEVVSPNIFSNKLWETSGHWDKYKENMFLLEDFHHHDNNKNEIEICDHDDTNETGETKETKEENKIIYGMKPMNCPCHCLIFKSMRPLSKDLPIRMAEFGVLHRNEASGALHGLTRVRRFQQDDAHIFCRFDQIQQEVSDTLNMIHRVYGLFNLGYTIKLSTRPKEFIGTVEIWVFTRRDMAEQILENAIIEFTGSDCVKNPGDGAFYGPKIDIVVTDKYNRNVQCGTIQLDFNLPSESRFNLKYMNEVDQQFHQPVIIHRAVLGSIERWIGIVLEHTQGHLPIQVSPYPIIIVTIHKEFNDAALKLRDHMHKKIRERNQKLSMDIDISADDIRNKVKSAEQKGYCYVITVGKREAEAIQTNIINGNVAVRINKKVQIYQIDKLLDELEAGLKLS